MRYHAFKMSRAMTVSILAAALLLGLMGMPEAAIQYKIIDLGGGSATGINNNGQVVGHSGDYPSQGFLWQKGSRQDFYDFYAYAINNAGQVLGSSDSGLLLWQNGSVQYLTGIPQGGAIGINDSGEIVGYDYTNGAWLWQNGSAQYLGVQGGEASAINNSGDVVGEYWPGGLLTAFLWHNGITQDLWAYGGPSAINGSGQVVGWAGADAILWQNGSTQDLGRLPGDYKSDALAVNATGQVVGWSMSMYGSAMRPFLWQVGTGMQALNMLAGGTGAALGINNAGQIVGWSTDATGYQHAVLWVPVPEPSSLLALGLGLLPLGLSCARNVVRLRER